ncbi:MAG: GNAT family N-acetyltransferase [Candidatus Poribacteria bacterium]|nr:GNAT family N-acetyltransferase [Candidatus Poribacteria bacterium]
MARQLRMVRPNLENLPALALPAGYGMRTYRKGDEEHWARIISDSFGGRERTAQDTKNEITSRDVFIPDGFYFAIHRGVPVGTACAWRQSVDEKEVGYVHMVGVVAEHTGHKLGKWVSLAVLAYFRDNGFISAMLDTDDFRIPAIKTYLNLGFVPVYVEEGQPERWRNIFQRLKLPHPSVQIANVEETLPAELWTKVSS